MGARVAATFSFVIVILSIVLACSASAQVATIVDSQGFEAPLFTTTFNTTGQLEGQTPATFNGTWARTKGIAASTANVQNVIKQSGNQAVVVHRAANSDDRWGVLVQGYPATRYVCISWGMRVEQTVGAPGTFGPFFGMEAYDTDAASIGLLGSLGVDASTGEVLFQRQNTGFLDVPATNPVVPFGAWNNFMVELDYLTHQYRYFLNGVVLGTEGFVDQNNVVGGLNEFTDANISAIAAAGDRGSQALVGTAFFDNFLVVESSLPCDGIIPEPGSCTLALLGVLGLRRIARRQVPVG
jgi:hypothetical protein